jgi:pimeloyl-ACP methyl ester carboxylesterase
MVPCRARDLVRQLFREAAVFGKVLGGLVITLVLAPASFAAVPRPDDDAFYVAPAGFAEAELGDVLRSREIEMTAVGVPIPLEGHQILYRTSDTHGDPEAAVATVVVPLTAAPAGGRPLLSYQPAEDTLTRDCSSSYEIRQGQMPELPEALVPLLKDGAAVVIPDYEGPESQWVAGVQAGHAVLDAVRATESFKPAGLPGTRTRVAVWGYSGGAQATAWAAELHPEYAPEIDLVGAAHGAAPYVLRETVAYLDGSPYAGILLAAVVGMGRAYPEMQLDEFFNDAGKAMQEQVGTQCIEDFAGEYPFAKLDDYTRVPNAKDLPNISAVIDDNDLGQRTPTAPAYIYQSATDELEPVAGADAIVANYCRNGVSVQYNRAAAGEHIEFQMRGAPEAAAYLADRFAGKPAPSTCPAPQTARKKRSARHRKRHRRSAAQRKLSDRT